MKTERPNLQTPSHPCEVCISCEAPSGPWKVTQVTGTTIQWRCCLWLGSWETQYVTIGVIFSCKLVKWKVHLDFSSTKRFKTKGLGLL